VKQAPTTTQHTSARSQGPAEGRHTTPLGSNTSAGQVAAVPEHSSALSHAPLDARHSNVDARNLQLSQHTPVSQSSPSSITLLPHFGGGGGIGVGGAVGTCHNRRVNNRIAGKLRRARTHVTIVGSITQLPEVSHEKPVSQAPRALTWHTAATLA
jgi:hypothetical protein